MHTHTACMSPPRASFQPCSEYDTPTVKHHPPLRKRYARRGRISSKSPAEQVGVASASSSMDHNGRCCKCSCMVFSTCRLSLDNPESTAHPKSKSMTALQCGAVCLTVLPFPGASVCAGLQGNNTLQSDAGCLLKLEQNCQPAQSIPQCPDPTAFTSQCPE